MLEKSALRKPTNKLIVLILIEFILIQILKFTNEITRYSKINVRNFSIIDLPKNQKYFHEQSKKEVFADEFLRS